MSVLNLWQQQMAGKFLSFLIRKKHFGTNYINWLRAITAIWYVKSILESQSLTKVNRWSFGAADDNVCEEYFLNLLWTQVAIKKHKLKFIVKLYMNLIQHPTSSLG